MLRSPCHTMKDYDYLPEVNIRFLQVAAFETVYQGGSSVPIIEMFL